MSTIIRQGDVKLVKVDSLPENVKPIEGTVLQESETTGHHHHFKPTAKIKIFETEMKESEDYLTITPDVGKFITVYEESDLFHGKGFVDNPATDGSGDHKALRITPGNYKVIIKREYDYSTKSHRRVVD